MRRNAPIFTLAGVVIAAAAWTLVPAKTGVPMHPNVTAAVQTPPAPAGTGMPAASAGYVVHLDGSGKVVTDPQAVSDADFNRALEKMFNTSSEGLQQVTLPNGMVSLNVQGRFMTAMVATKDATGKVTIPCLTNENDVKAFEASAASQAARKE
jgi:hypothetical protein